MHKNILAKEKLVEFSNQINSKWGKFGPFYNIAHSGPSYQAYLLVGVCGGVWVFTAMTIEKESCWLGGRNLFYAKTRGTGGNLFFHQLFHQLKKVYISISLYKVVISNAKMAFMLIISDPTRLLNSGYNRDVLVKSYRHYKHKSMASELRSSFS